MKNLILALAIAAPLLSTTSAFAGAGEQTTIGSVYTDLTKDCVIVEAATENAPIDFYTTDCKAFGGYGLQIKGSDLRYHPVLSFGGKELDWNQPSGFHDIPSNKVEWVYSKTTSLEDGSGSLAWIGFIFRLSVYDPETDKNTQKLFAVRLNGAKTCLLGAVKSNQEARALVQDSKAACQ